METIWHYLRLFAHPSALLLLSLALTNGSVGPAWASPPATPDEHGPVTSIALDAKGNGYFATGTDQGYLSIQRLENGRPPWLTYGNPANKDRGITRMVLTARADDGWAVGFEGSRLALSLSSRPTARNAPNDCAIGNCLITIWTA